MIKLGNTTRKGYKDKNVCHKIVALRRNGTIVLPQVDNYQSDGKIKYFCYFELIKNAPLRKIQLKFFKFISLLRYFQ